jgi:hypothetical protein
MIKLLNEIDLLKLIVYSYALVVSCVEGIKLTRNVIRRSKTRHLRKVWGIKDKEDVILVCSELDNPETEQIVDGEFIYSRKYGDLDAYIEVVYTLLRLYPNLKLKILSCGEAAKIRLEYEKTIVLIGGPDYNSTTEELLQYTQFEYRSKDWVKSIKYPDDIALLHKGTQEEFCGNISKKDFGYFERIKNPHNSKKYVIMIGGCHTIGVTGAIKAFSLVPNEQGEIKNYVLSNAKKVAKKISKKSQFAVVLRAEKANQTIHTPEVKEDSIFVLNK